MEKHINLDLSPFSWEYHVKSLCKTTNTSSIEECMGVNELEKFPDYIWLVQHITELPTAKQDLLNRVIEFREKRRKQLLSQLDKYKNEILERITNVPKGIDESRKSEIMALSRQFKQQEKECEKAKLEHDRKTAPLQRIFEEKVSSPFYKLNPPYSGFFKGLVRSSSTLLDRMNPDYIQAYKEEILKMRNIKVDISHKALLSTIQSKLKTYSPEQKSMPELTEDIEKYIQELVCIRRNAEHLLEVFSEVSVSDFKDSKGKLDCVADEGKELAAKTDKEIKEMQSVVQRIEVILMDFQVQKDLILQGNMSFEPSFIKQYSIVQDL